MKSAAVVFPSINVERATVAAERWSAMGYDVFIYLECDMPAIPKAFCYWGRYAGWYQACNMLCKLCYDYPAVICIGDDMDPDPHQSPLAIVEQCYMQYGDLWVMQPTGDKLQGPDICGSPWLSQEWRARAYGGKFALPGWYYHQFGDNELLAVAKELGVLHKRHDLTQYHHHWMRKGSGIERKDYQAAFAKHWGADEKIYHDRKAAGWPGKELL